MNTIARIITTHVIRNISTCYKRCCNSKPNLWVQFLLEFIMFKTHQGGSNENQSSTYFKIMEKFDSHLNFSKSRKILSDDILTNNRFHYWITQSDWRFRELKAITFFVVSFSVLFRVPTEGFAPLFPYPWYTYGSTDCYPSVLFMIPILSKQPQNFAINKHFAANILIFRTNCAKKFLVKIKKKTPIIIGRK